MGPQWARPGHPQGPGGGVLLDLSQPALRGAGLALFCSPEHAAILRKAAGIDKGSQTPGRGFVGKVTEAQLRQIAEELGAETRH